jgi:uncharacterized protein YdhG (YjbR/CyaY superfamily)
MTKFTSVEQYLSSFEPVIKARLIQVRNAIKISAPDAIEVISYNIPAYRYKGKVLIYFAGYAKHIGLYATPTGHSKFAKELSQYTQGKGSVQFPHSKPLPLTLIKNITKFRKTQIDNSVSS